MPGKILNRIRKDVQRINSRLGFEESFTLQNPDKTLTLELKGIHTKHSLSFDSVGQRVNSKNAHILINEADLIAVSYPYRNKTGNVHLLKHLITASDSTGVQKEYVITENYPSETFGMIVCILQDRSENGANNRRYTNPKL